MAGRLIDATFLRATPVQSRKDPFIVRLDHQGTQVSFLPKRRLSKRFLFFVFHFSYSFLIFREQTDAQMQKSENCFQNTRLQEPYSLKTKYTPPLSFGLGCADPRLPLRRKITSGEPEKKADVLTGAPRRKFSTSRFRLKAPRSINPGLIPPSPRP